MRREIPSLTPENYKVSDSPLRSTDYLRTNASVSRNGEFFCGYYFLLLLLLSLLARHCWLFSFFSWEKIPGKAWSSWPTLRVVVCGLKFHFFFRLWRLLLRRWRRWLFRSVCATHRDFPHELCCTCQRDVLSMVWMALNALCIPLLLSPPLLCCCVAGSICCQIFTSC